MSSVDSSDNVNRRNREEFRAKEAENNKKHKTELKRLAEDRDQEIEELQKDHAEQLSDLQKRYREVLTDRDQKYQDEIENVRSMYKEQLQKKSSEAELRRAMALESGQAALNKEREVNAMQKDRMSNSYEQTIRDKEKNYTEYSKQMREGLQEKVNEQRDKLNTSHSKEVNELNHSFDKERSSWQRDYTRARNMYESSVKDLDRHYDNRVSKMSANFEDQVQSKDRRYGNMLLDKDVQAQEANEKLKNKYAKIYGDKVNNYNSSIESFKDDVQSRIDRDVRSRDNQIMALKDSKVSDTLSSNRLRELERGHLIRDYESKLKDLEVQRDSANDNATELMHKRINDISFKKDKLLRDQGQNLQQKMELSDITHKSDKEQMRAFYEGMTDRNRTQAELAVRRNMENTAESQNQFLRHYENKLDQVKDSYRESLMQNREKNIEDITKMQVRVEQKLRDTEKKYQTKIDDLTKQYDKLLNGMKENQIKEMRSVELMTKQKIKDREKAHQLELETVKSRYENKLAQQEDVNSRNIDKLQQRHEEDVNNIARRVEYSNRKV